MNGLENFVWCGYRSSVAGLVDPHWLQCGSGSRFSPQCGSGSREPNNWRNKLNGAEKEIWSPIQRCDIFWNFNIINTLCRNSFDTVPWGKLVTKATWYSAKQASFWTPEDQPQVLFLHIHLAGIIFKGILPLRTIFQFSIWYTLLKILSAKILFF